MAAQIGEFEIIINEILNILPFLIPVIIIQWTLLILALVLAIKNDVAYLPKWAWIVIILIVNIIGPIIFLIAGRCNNKNRMDRKCQGQWKDVKHIPQRH